MRNQEIFGSRLRELRKSKNVLAKDLANELGITKPSISLYEQGKGYPTVEKLMLIADFFDVSTDYLLGRTYSMKVSE